MHAVLLDLLHASESSSGAHRYKHIALVQVRSFSAYAGWLWPSVSVLSSNCFLLGRKVEAGIVAVV